MDMKNKLLNHNNDEEEIFNGSVREISKIFEENGNDFEIINLPALKEIKDLEKKIKELEEDMNKKKKNEINRIFKEYIDNDYQNKYQAPIYVVLGALFGEHLRNIQVNKFNTFKKEYLDEIKNIRFYEYSKKNECS